VNGDTPYTDENLNLS